MAVTLAGKGEKYRFAASYFDLIRFPKYVPVPVQNTYTYTRKTWDRPIALKLCQGNDDDLIRTSKMIEIECGTQ